MSEPRRRHLANAAFSGADLYAEYGAAFVASIVVARALGPERYGSYTLLLWLATVGIALANHGITTGAMKFIGEARGRGSEALARALLFRLEGAQLLSGLAAVLLLAAAFLLVPELLVEDPEARDLLWILLPGVLLRAIHAYYLAAAKGFEDFRLAAKVRLAVAPLALAFVVAAALLGGSLEAFLLAWLAGGATYALGMRAALLRGRPRGPASGPGARPDAALLRRVRRHVGYASAIVLLDLLILKQTEIFFLGLYATEEAIAFYGLGRSLSGSALLLVPGVFTALLLPAMSRTFGEAPELMGRRFLAATRYILILAVPVVALGEVFATDLITLLYGEAYAPAALVLRVALAAGMVGVVSASASSWQLSVDRQPAVVAIMAGTAAATLALDVLLISRYGLVGAIVAGATGALLLGGGLLVHAHLRLRVRPELGVHARILAAGLCAALPALAAERLLPPWAALPLGGLAAAPVYLGASVLLGAWSPADLDFLESLATRLPHRLGRHAVRLLSRARRAGRAEGSER